MVRLLRGHGHQVLVDAVLEGPGLPRVLRILAKLDLESQNAMNKYYFSEMIALPEGGQFQQIRSESVHIPQAGEILMTKIPSHGLSR